MLDMLDSVGQMANGHFRQKPPQSRGNLDLLECWTRFLVFCRRVQHSNTPPAEGKNRRNHAGK